MLFFGLVAVGGTYWVQALAWPPDALLAGAGLGALSTALLVVNNLRDIETDERAGKRTLAVRLGRAGTRAEYVLLLGVAAVVPPIGVAAYGWPVAALAALLAAPLGASPLRAVLRADDPRDLIAALAATARVVALYGGLLALALAFGGWSSTSSRAAPRRRTASPATTPSARGPTARFPCGSTSARRTSTPWATARVRSCRWFSTQTPKGW
jgi:1,4-dihydroxy-2-naphthoate octaprenyltransferase